MQKKTKLTILLSNIVGQQFPKLGESPQSKKTRER